MPKPQVPLTYARIPSADFQWTAFGAEQYLATDRTALEISGRVEIASHIKSPTRSRNGQLSISSFSSNSSSLTPTLSGTLLTEVTWNFFTNFSAKLCWDIVRVPLLRSLEYRHPPYHFKSRRFSTVIVRFKSTHNPDAPFLLSYSKNIIDVHNCCDCHTSILNQTKNTYICHALLET